MRSDDFDPKRRLVHLHYADTMDESHRFDGPLLFHLIEQEMELMLGHLSECLVINCRNRRALLAAPHHAGKINRRAHPVRHDALRDERVFVDADHS